MSMILSGLIYCLKSYCISCEQVDLPVGDNWLVVADAMRTTCFMSYEAVEVSKTHE